jgi:hypothetical protein
MADAQPMLIALMSTFGAALALQIGEVMQRASFSFLPLSTRHNQPSRWQQGSADFLLTPLMKQKVGSCRRSPDTVHCLINIKPPVVQFRIDRLCVRDG